MYFSFSEPCPAKPFAAALQLAFWRFSSEQDWRCFDILAKVYCEKVYGFCILGHSLLTEHDRDILRHAFDKIDDQWEGFADQVSATSFLEIHDLDPMAFVPLPDFRHADDMDSYWPLFRKRLVASELCTWYERHGQVQLTPDSDDDSDDEKGVILEIPSSAIPPSPEFGAARDSDAAIFHSSLPPLVIPSMEDDDVFPTLPPTLVRSDGFFDLPATPILLDCPACLPYDCKCD